MINTKYFSTEFCSLEDEDCSKKNKDVTLLMWNYAYFKKNAHTGFEFGLGVGEDLLIVKAGLKFRFF